MARPLQVVSHIDSNGKLTYVYKVENGISMNSSVMEILEERGLARPGIDMRLVFIENMNDKKQK